MSYSCLVIVGFNFEMKCLTLKSGQRHMEMQHYRLCHYASSPAEFVLFSYQASWLVSRCATGSKRKSCPRIVSEECKMVPSAQSGLSDFPIQLATMILTQIQTSCSSCGVSCIALWQVFSLGPLSSFGIRGRSTAQFVLCSYRSSTPHWTEEMLLPYN
jgi:hypothetical protein